MKRDKAVSLTGLAFTLGLTLGVVASGEVNQPDAGSGSFAVAQTAFVTEQSGTSYVNVMDHALARAILFEGFEPEVYTFRGECHIGYGHRTSCNNTDVMTREGAVSLLQADMSLIQGELIQALGFYSKLPPNAQLVLLDMGFNMGLTNLLEFEDMLGYLELGEWWKAMSEIEDSLYWEQVNNRANANINLLFEVLDEEEGFYEPSNTTRRVF